MSLEQVIVELLTKDGIAAVVAFFLSQFVPMFVPGFEQWTSWHKRVAIISICLGTPILVTIVGTVIGVIPDGSFSMVLQNLMTALEVGFAAFIGSQYAHARKDLRKKSTA